jgi:hypothetical protein
MFQMKDLRSKLTRRGLTLAAAILFCTSFSRAQTCLTTDDMDDATRANLVSTAERYFHMAASGDVAGLRQNAIASVAANFGGIETAIKDNQSVLANVQPQPRQPFLLKADGSAPLEHGEFLCGIFGASGQTANSVVFTLNGLQPGNYAVIALDAPASPVPYTVAFVLQQEGTAWKLGGYYVKAAQLNGHDGLWYSQKAREFKTKGQLHNAWFYQLEARDLLVYVPFMSTQATDQLYDDFEKAKPADLPPVDLVAGTKTFHLTAMFPMGYQNDLDLVAKYSSTDVSNTVQAFQDNVAVAKALVAKYPELRDAFGAVVARATESSGKDYGTLLTMKDIK